MGLILKRGHTPRWIPGNPHPECVDISMKTCRLCGILKPVAGFHSGSSYCSRCRSKRYREKNPEKMAAYHRAYSLKNHKRLAERKSAADKILRKNPKVRLRLAIRAREYRKRIRPYINTRRRLRSSGASIAQLRGLVDGYLGRCAYCFEPLSTVTIDHIIPVVCGGTNEIGNLAPACLRCNASKGKKPLIVWLAGRLAA